MEGASAHGVGIVSSVKIKLPGYHLFQFSITFDSPLDCQLFSEMKSITLALHVTISEITFLVIFEDGLSLS